ncbi:unnamed protein product [Rhizoctonia solani]|uniref:Uncharacterized protein n=1 Tax=Rhizoctonia solani TaxID=456999 RepID=A0A8H3E165_9AGAM|nr:unnamed protein product [Rhizoctonia solani]
MPGALTPALKPPKRRLMQFSSLPLEVVHIILRLVPEGSLAPASLGQGLLKKIIKEDKEGGSIMDEEDLEVFSSVAIKLKNLEWLDWTVSQEVEWYGTLVLLYQELPKLRLLSLDMTQDEILLGDLDECVSFTSLRELSITFGGLAYYESPDEGPLRTLVQLIRGARNIEALCLSFDAVEEEDSAAPWGSVELFSELGSDHFPNLRVIETHSQHLVPISNHYTVVAPGSGNLFKNTVNLRQYVS